MPPRIDLLLPISVRDHAEGAATAPITLLEYGDYQCPYCGAAYPLLKEIQKQLGKDLRFIFRNFPLTQMHPNAEIAAEAAEAAGERGKFWEMHDALYENQEMLERDHIESIATRIGLDASRFGADLTSRRFQARVRRDFLGGVRSGVSGTPGFFINGTRFEGSWNGREFVDALIDARDARAA